MSLLKTADVVSRLAVCAQKHVPQLNKVSSDSLELNMFIIIIIIIIIEHRHTEQ